MHLPLKLVLLLCAEAYLIIARLNEITILLKRRDQRRLSEQQTVEHGLFRSIAVEALLAVPASAVLAAFILLPLAMQIGWVQRISPYAVHGLLGLICYQFPYSVLRTLLTRSGLKELTKYKEVQQEYRGLVRLENESLTRLENEENLKSPSSRRKKKKAPNKIDNRCEASPQDGKESRQELPNEQDRKARDASQGE